jgi:2-oxoglutarate dehydrogenase E2 component (dihydrolipoamide succinyltransferase)
MLIDIIVPEAGESITQVELARWLVTNGQYIEKDQEIAEIDSDKATLTISATASGAISIKLEEGSETKPGEVIAVLDTEAEKPVKTDEPEKESLKDGNKDSEKSTAGVDEPTDDTKVVDAGKTGDHDSKKSIDHPFTFSPQARKTMDEIGVGMSGLSIKSDSKRITKKDVLAAIAGKTRSEGPGSKTEQHTSFSQSWGGGREEQRQKMSTLRRKIAERLVAVKNQTAMLTTFNEVDMSAIMALRATYQDAFTKKYGFKLGFMSFFAKALAESIPFFPEVNGYIDNNHIVMPAFADIGIAVSTPKGLMVPIIRNAEALTIPQLEEKIQEMAAKARDGKIDLEDLKGGTISITNGGIFGSMLSTPIINPPQSAILGMHNILDRPVVKDGQIVIRPMMYLALSYDHRIVDGKESVGFLVKVKELIENPSRLLYGGKHPETMLLGL